MKGTRGKSGGGGRAITPEEADLWNLATRTMQPVKAKARVTPVPTPAAGPPRVPLATTKSNPARPAPQLTAEPQPPVKSSKAPPIAEFDRRRVRQIASGKIEIEAKIDLHGDYQRDARQRLRAFLFAAYANGRKIVLVITGKGSKEPPDRLGELRGERQRGVLRANVPRWLEEPELRAIVLSFTEASPRHGGGGALYVRLRKATTTK